MINESDDLPPEMSLEQTAAVLSVVRSPRLLLTFLKCLADEIVPLLLEDGVKDPEWEVDIEHRAVGLIIALRPMLRSAVDRLSLHSLDRRVITAKDEDCGWMPLYYRGNAPYSAWEALDAKVSRLEPELWKRFALTTIATPEKVIRDAVTVEGFRRTLHLIEASSATFTDGEVRTLNLAINGPCPENVLRILRDIGRLLGSGLPAG